MLKFILITFGYFFAICASGVLTYNFFGKQYCFEINEAEILAQKLLNLESIRTKIIQNEFHKVMLRPDLFCFHHQLAFEFVNLLDGSGLNRSKEEKKNEIILGQVAKYANGNQRIICSWIKCPSDPNETKKSVDQFQKLYLNKQQR